MKRYLGAGPVSLLVGWSWRRVVHKVKFFWRVFRLVVDWTVALYLVIPAAVGLTYAFIRYYHGDFTHGITGSTPVLGPLTLSATTHVILALVFFVIHLALYGHIPFPMESGDRLFVMLSPIRKGWILAALWAETAVASAIPFAVIAICTLPLCWVIGVHAGMWIGTLALFAGYESTVRLLSRQWNPELRFSWRRWLLYTVIRLVSFVPLARTTAEVWSGNRYSVLWMAIFTLVVTAASVPYLLRCPWDAFFQSRPSGALSLVIPPEQDANSRIRFRMKRLPQVVIGFVERKRRRPLSPATWFIVTRALRRVGFLRDLLLLTSAVEAGMYSAPFAWLKGAFYACGLFMVFQWWNLTVRPLYDAPMKEQNVVNRWTLAVDANKVRLWLVAIAGLIWLSIWCVLRL